MRLLAFPYRGLVVEATMADLERGEWRNQLTPAQVIGSVLGWSLMGLPVHLVGSHEAAGKAVARLLAIAARREWRQCRTFAVGVLDEASEGSEAA